MACLCKCCEATQNVKVQTAGATRHLIILIPDEGSHVHAVLAYAGVKIRPHLFVTSLLGGGERYLHALRKQLRLPCPLNMRLGRPQVVSLCFQEEINLLAMAGIGP